MIPLDHALKALAVLVIVWILINIALPSLPAQANVVAKFFVFLAVVMAVVSGATLLATDFLYPGALSFAGITDLLQFLALGAALSALFMVFAQGPVVRMLKWLGMGGGWAETGFALAHGLATALLLVVFARHAPGVELVIGGALAAGLICASGFHLVEMIFVYSGPADTGEMALIDSDYCDKGFDEGDDQGEATDNPDEKIKRTRQTP